MEDMASVDAQTPPDGRIFRQEQKKGGSILEVLDDMIKVGQTMGFTMEGLGSKAKKLWIRELNIKHKVRFLSIQETKTDSITAMEAKVLWGNSNFEHIFSEAIGNSGGILCMWDPNVFLKDQHIISDNFSFIMGLISRWNGESMVMGDFNEVRFERDRLGSVFNAQGANEFNSFILNAGLVEIQLEGYSFTWSHPSASKMSNWFLVTDGLLSLFPHISAICLDKNLSDHRPILLREVITDYEATPFRLYHSWFNLHGFEQMVSTAWNSIVLDDTNRMVRLKKKLQMLKKEIRSWVADYKQKQSGHLNDIKSKLSDIDKILDQGGMFDDLLLSRMDLMKQMQDIKTNDVRDQMQKAKIQWAIEGDENSKFFHGIINKKRVHLSIKGIMVDGEWVDDPSRVKDEFRSHFATRFQDPGVRRSRLN
ncbi:RNA-directed DNA polymerase, eukaryota, partial [Tanacetum coccineum]